MRVVKVYGGLFLATGVPFGLFMGLALGALYAVADLGDGFSEGLLVGLVGGGLFGLLMALTLGTMQLLGFRDAPRGLSLSPRQTREVPVANGPDLADRVVSALRSLPAEVTAVDVPAGRYVARRGTSWKSWGEDIVVQLSGDPTQPVATVSSRPRLGTTLIDYGRGRRNVDHVVAALSAPAPTVGQELRP